MKQLSIFQPILMALLMSLGLASCGGDDDDSSIVAGNDGVVATGAVSDVTAHSATITGTVAASFLTNASVKVFGVSYGKDIDADDNYRTTSIITDTTFTITVTNLASETDYYYKAYIVDNNGNKIFGSTQKFTTTKPSVTSGKVIDLGLSVKWAAYNVGASSPEDYGDYFAWGETTPKSSYDSDNSTTYGVSYSTLQSRGIIDSDGNLTAAYDAATANWGGSWRMPTEAEIDELIENCTTEWTTINGVAGCLVTSKKNGHSIFLPAAGCHYGTSLNNAGSFGGYWSSTPFESGTIGAYGLYFGVSYFNRDWSGRYYGRSVRPVLE